MVARHFCNCSCKAEWQRTKKPVDVEWLRKKYLEERLTCSQIAGLVHRNQKRVWEWLRNLGIPTRQRGHSSHITLGPPPSFRGHQHTAATRAKIRQARINEGRIPAYINGVHWLRAYNRKPATWKGGISPERQAFYATAEWKSAARIVWQRDQGRCRQCNGLAGTLDRKMGTFHIHHIDSFMIRERRADTTNLVLLCRLCHLWTHSKKNTERVFLGQGH